MSGSLSHEYINDFLFFVLKSDNENSTTLHYSSGVNVDRFLPITKGRHRPMSNPAIRGLQLVNLGVRALALAGGATPKALRGSNSSGIIPAKGYWVTEQLLIEGAPQSLPEEVIHYAATELLKKIDRAIVLGAALPDKLLNPRDLQLYLEELCREYGG